MKTKWILIGCIFLASTLEARVVKPARSSKTSCLGIELKRKNCEMRSAKLKVGFFQDKWRYDDGKWLSNQNIPVSGDQVVRQKILMKKHGSRMIVEAWIWGEPKGEGMVQELNWLVFEAGGYAKAPLLQKVVQRRRQLPARQVASAGSSVKPRYQHDPLEKHGLVLSKGRLQWYAGRDKGVTE